MAADLRPRVGPTALDDAGPHHRCRHRPVRAPRLRRGQRRRRRRRPPASPAAPSSATTRPRTPSRGGTSTLTSTTCATCSTPSRRVPLREALRTALLAFNTFTTPRRHGTGTDAGHPGDRRTAGVLDDHVCGLARGRRRFRGAPARRQGATTSSRRPWRGRCSASRCRPTSTGSPTNPCRLRTGAGRRVRHRQRRAAGDWIRRVSAGHRMLFKRNPRSGRRSSRRRWRR